MSACELVVELAPRVRAALVAAYGVEAGRDAAAEAVTWALENPERLRQLDNPAGYLYRVGQTAARRERRPQRLLPAEPSQDLPDIEPGLVPALMALTDHQRQVVVMVHAFGWPQADVAEVLTISPSTVAAHLRQAMRALRSALEVSVDG